jgi:hypothetical protein
MRKDIEAHYPGTKIAITEYNYGAADHISGGIAHADALGIFGREGVFAANWWNLGNGDKLVNAAFDLYLNYDGKGAHFGDQSVFAASEDVESASIYASFDQANPSAVTMILINRAERAIDARIRIAHGKALDNAVIYQLTGAAAKINRAGEQPLKQANELQYLMPPMSASVIRLSPAR